MQPFILLVYHKSCVLYTATVVCEVSMETLKEPVGFETPPGLEYFGFERSLLNYFQITPEELYQAWRPCSRPPPGWAVPPQRSSPLLWSPGDATRFLEVLDSLQKQTSSFSRVSSAANRLWNVGQWRDGASLHGFASVCWLRAADSFTPHRHHVSP